MLALCNQQAESVKSTLKCASLEPDLSNTDLLAIQQPFRRYFLTIHFILFSQAPQFDMVKATAHLNWRNTIGSDWTQKCRLNQVRLEQELQTGSNVRRMFCTERDGSIGSVAQSIILYQCLLLVYHPPPSPRGTQGH